MPGASAAALAVAACCWLQGAAVRLQRAPPPDVAQAVELGRRAERALTEGPLRQMGPLALSTAAYGARLPTDKDSRAWGGDRVKAVGVTGAIGGDFSAGAFGTAGTDAAKAGHALYGAGYRGLEGRNKYGLPSAYGLVGAAEVQPGAAEAVHAVPSREGGADWAHAQVKFSGGHLTSEQFPSWAKAGVPGAEAEAPKQAAQAVPVAARLFAEVRGSPAPGEAAPSMQQDAAPSTQEEGAGSNWLSKVGDVMKIVTATQAPTAAPRLSNGRFRDDGLFRRFKEAFARPPTPQEHKRRKDLLQKLSEQLQPTPEQLEQGKDLLKKLEESARPVLEKLGQDGSKDLVKKIGEDLFKQLGGKVPAAAKEAGGAAAEGPDWLKSLQQVLAGLKP